MISVWTLWKTHILLDEFRFRPHLTWVLILWRAGLAVLWYPGDGGRHEPDVGERSPVQPARLQALQGLDPAAEGAAEEDGRDVG